MHEREQQEEYGGVDDELVEGDDTQAIPLLRAQVLLLVQNLLRLCKSFLLL